VARVKSAVPESRRERANRTRARMIDAAYRLFCERGWEATTMQLVADEAAVAVQTVYFTFRTKAQLLAAVEERAVLGDAPRSEFFERWARRVADENNARRLIGTFVDTDTEIKRRLTPLVAGLGSFLPGDPMTNERRDSGRDRFFASLITRLQQLNALRDGLTPECALDILRVLNAQGAFSELVLERGWSEDDWKRWMIALLTEQLVAEPL
jgi:AcrR family transcriptional regulator